MASLGHESESEPRTRIFDSIPSPIHTGRPDGYLGYFNQHWLEYLGIPIGALLGWKWTAVTHPEDVDDIVAKWRLSIASGEPFLHEARVRRADGEHRWMLHHKVALHDEHGKIIKWYGSSIDIEERKRAEFKIRAQETELLQMLDLSPQHVAVIGPGQERSFANRALLNYFGFRLEEWQSRDSQTRVHPDDWEHLVWGPQGGPPDQASRVEVPAAFKGEAEPRSEREIIEAALAATRGRVSRPSGAAAKLGIPPSTLDHRIKALKINKRRFGFV